MLFLSVGSKLNGIVEKRPKPSLYRKASKGLIEVTTTYIRMSNLYPLISNGFLMYFYTTIGSP